MLFKTKSKSIFNKIVSKEQSEPLAGLSWHLIEGKSALE